MGPGGGGRSGCGGKTVVVLDHGPVLGAACGEAVLEGKEGGWGPVEKSLWTCAVEAALEYRRLTSDLLPEGLALLRLVVSDFVGRSLAPSWAPASQTVENLLQTLASIAAPDVDGDPDMCSVAPGLSLAVEALSQPSDAQKALLKAAKGKAVLSNSGRIILITQLRSPEHLAELHAHFLEQVASRNKLAASLDDFLPLETVELCVVHVIGVKESLSPDLLSRKLAELESPLVGPKTRALAELRSSLGGAALVGTLQGLAMDHYSLASTTVTAIPMKEEQTSGQSANYDVELFHRKECHGDLRRLGLLDGPESLLLAGPNGYPTLSLRWCSPNAKAGLSADGLFVCSAVERASPVSVASRPSACLTSFLLSGRTVMLEVPRKGSSVAPLGTAAKPISHLLTCHAGHIYLHAIAQGTAFEDPPSISEGPGGKVGDYRIAAFAEFIREHQLGPPADGVGAEGRVGNKAARVRLELDTADWALTLGESLLGVLSGTASAVEAWLAPALAALRKAVLSEPDIVCVRDALFRLITMQNNGEALPPAATASARLRGQRKDQHYRLLFQEVEAYLRSVSHISAQHLALFNIWLHFISKPIVGVSVPPMECPEREARLLAIDAELGAAAVEAEEGEVCEGGSKDRPTADPAAPEAPPRGAVSVVLPPLGEKRRTLLSVFQEEEAKRWVGWRDFAGRQAAGDKPAQLYRSLMEQDQKLRKGQVAMEQE